MFSLDRRRFASAEERTPSAAELLEASKSFFVKTEAIRARRIDPLAPRLFRSPSEEELEAMSAAPPVDPPLRFQPNYAPNGGWNNRRVPIAVPQPLPMSSLLNVTPRSAFKPFVQTPPRPPKSEALRRRQSQLAAVANPPAAFSPHYEHVNFEQPSVKVEVEAKAASTKPQPPPRPSLLQLKKTPPVAPPRRRLTTTLDGRLPTAMTQSMYVEKEAPVLVRSQATSTTNLARSTPDLTLDLDLSLVATPSAAQATISIDDSNATTSDSPSASTPPRPPNKPPMLRDRPVGHQKPPRPTLSTRRSGGSFPSPDSSRDSGVVDDSLLTPDLMAADPDFEERVRRWERQRTLTTPLQLPPKRVEPVRKLSGPSAASDELSDFTSVSAAAARRDVESTSGETAGARPVSMLEKNARVLSWIYGCSTAERGRV